MLSKFTVMWIIDLNVQVIKVSQFWNCVTDIYRFCQTWLREQKVISCAHKIIGLLTMFENVQSHKVIYSLRIKCKAWPYTTGIVKAYSLTEVCGLELPVVLFDSRLWWTVMITIFVTCWHVDQLCPRIDQLCLMQPFLTCRFVGWIYL